MSSCNICGASFKNLLEFNCHQENSHNLRTLQIPCALCSNTFKKVFSFINHILYKHLHLEHLRYCCLICDAMFYNLTPLYNHLKNCHGSIETRRIFQCIICGHHSESLPLLKKHKRVHDNDAESEEIERIYSAFKDTGSKLTLKVDDCYKNDDGTVSVECQKSFMKWSDFRMNCYMCSAKDLSTIDYYLHHHNEHMDWTVYGKSPNPYKFVCKDCPFETFASLVTFCSHQVYKHEHEDLSYRCPVCSKLFWNYVAYSCHLKYLHPVS